MDFPKAYGDEIEYHLMRKYCHIGFLAQHVIVIFYFRFCISSCLSLVPFLSRMNLAPGPGRMSLSPPLLSFGHSFVFILPSRVFCPPQYSFILSFKTGGCVCFDQVFVLTTLKSSFLLTLSRLHSLCAAVLSFLSEVIAFIPNLAGLQEWK